MLCTHWQLNHRTILCAAPHWCNLQMPISTFFQADDHDVVHDLPHPCFTSRLMGPYVMGHTELTSCLACCPASHQASQLQTHSPAHPLLTTYLNPISTQSSSTAIPHAQAIQHSTRQRSNSTAVSSYLNAVDIRINSIMQSYQLSHSRPPLNRRRLGPTGNVVSDWLHALVLCHLVVL